jgi:hypothetical protein
MATERSKTSLHPHADEASPLDTASAREIAEGPRPVYRRPPRKGALAQWLAEMRCLWFGHLWRDSRHFEAYETCSRCRARRPAR